MVRVAAWRRLKKPMGVVERWGDQSLGKRLAIERCLCQKPTAADRREWGLSKRYPPSTPVTTLVYHLPRPILFDAERNLCKPPELEGHLPGPTSRGVAGRERERPPQPLPASKR